MNLINQYINADKFVSAPTTNIHTHRIIYFTHLYRITKKIEINARKKQSVVTVT